LKVEFEKLSASLKKYPRRQSKLIGDAVRTSTLDGVAKARAFAPSGKTGGLRQGIHAKFEFRKNSMVGSVEAAPATAKDQIKALSVEFGRQYTSRTRQPRLTGKFKTTGTTEPQSFIRTTWLLLGRKHMRKIKRAINKAAKENGLK